MSKCLVKWIYYMVYYKKEDVTFITNVLSYLFTVFTTLVFRLIIPALLTMMLSVRSTSVIEIVLFNVVNFSRWPITRSTLILTCATCLDMSISLAVICFFPLEMRVCKVLLFLLPVPPQPRNLDQLIHNLHELDYLENLILRWFPYQRLPPQPAKRKLTAPAGVMPIRYLIVSWDL